MNRAEAGLDLSIRNILLGSCGDAVGGVRGKDEKQEARKEAGVEGILTWSWGWRG